MITAGSYSFMACPVLTETSDDTVLSAIASSDKRKWKKEKRNPTSAQRFQKFFYSILWALGFLFAQQTRAFEVVSKKTERKKKRLAEKWESIERK